MGGKERIIYFEPLDIGSTLEIGTPENRIAISNSVVVDIKQFALCMLPPVCNINRTLVVKLTTGPEDPRIFTHNESKYISFFSYDNTIGANYPYGIGIYKYDLNYVGY